MNRFQNWLASVPITESGPNAATRDEQVAASPLKVKGEDAGKCSAT